LAAVLVVNWLCSVRAAILRGNGVGGVIIIVGYSQHAKHVLHVGEGWGVTLVPSRGGCCIQLALEHLLDDAIERNQRLVGFAE
jgi:hypothetical protein